MEIKQPAPDQPVVKEEIKRAIKDTLRQMKMETHQNLWDVTKTVVGGKFTAINAYIEKQDRSQINKLTLYLKELGKKPLMKPKISRREEIKIRAEIKIIETKKTVEKSNKTKLFFLLKR